MPTKQNRDESLYGFKKAKPTPEMLGTGMAKRAGQALKDRNKRIEAELKKAGA